MDTSLEAWKLTYSWSLWVPSWRGSGPAIRGIGGTILAWRPGLGPKLKKALQHPIGASLPAWIVSAPGSCPSAKMIWYHVDQWVASRSSSKQPTANLLLPLVHHLPLLGPDLFLLKEKIGLDWWFLNLSHETLYLKKKNSLWRLVVFEGTQNPLSVSNHTLKARELSLTVHWLGDPILCSFSLLVLPLAHIYQALF